MKQQDVPIYSKLNYNKAFYSINTSLLPRGFCVNDTLDWSGIGWHCDLTQATFSNSYFNGSPSFSIDKSYGYPSWKSDATHASSLMAHGQPASGNPVRTSDYTPSFKWGKDWTAKWSSLPTRPDPEESSLDYEGEYSLLLRIVSRIYANV